MPKKKAAVAKKRAAKSPSLFSASPLAAMTDSLVCDCLGDTIAAINDAGRALLGGKAKAGRSLSAYFRDSGGKPVKNIAALAKGRQPKHLVLVDGKASGLLLDVTVKALGGAGARARALVVARATPAPPAPPAPTSATPGTPEIAKPAPEPAKDLATQASLTAQILSAASKGIIALDLNGIITLANPAAADLLNRDSGAMRCMPIERAFIYGAGHPEAGKPIPIRAQLNDGPYYLDREVQMARTDGETFEAVYVVVPVMAAQRAVGYVITFRDITRRRRAEAEMRLAGVVFDHSPEGIVVADDTGRVTKVNPAYGRIAGIPAASVIGRQLPEILAAESNSPAGALNLLQGGDQRQWEQWNKSGDGRRYAAGISISVVRDHDASVQQYVAIISDVTQRKLDEEKITYQANYDQLTSLPNRTLFMDRLTRLVLESRRAKSSVGLMFIDLDGFKAINDTLGHDAGDELLKATARRLEKCVREADTVARLGGDEFTVIMPLIDNFEGAGYVAGRIIKSLTEPFDLGGRVGNVSASIGISLLPAQAATAADLLHNADVAMYHAKRQGKANYQPYKPELEAIVTVKDREL